MNKSNNNTESITDYLCYRMLRDFYAVNGLDLAKDLLGKIIVRKLEDGSIVRCRIVETEAYMAPEDKACHAYNNKKTERTKYFWQKAGGLYIYTIYMPDNFCINISSLDEKSPQAVLIRAVEPISGVENIMKLRKISLGSTKAKIVNLTNGPAKTGKSLNMSKDMNGVDLVTSDEIFLMKEENELKFEIGTSSRINIDYAKEYIDKPWRFYIKGNPFVSKVPAKKK